MKGIIVVDIPKDCRECGRYRIGNYGVLSCGVNGWFISEYVDCKNYMKPDWCPIKPIPEKMDADACSAQSRCIATGYNHCIDKILKGAENGQEQATDR